jgi:hypothetical protein
VRCLSVQQPWAWALLEGGKDVENRTWKTPYRGPLLIHAGKRFDTEAYEYWPECADYTDEQWLQVETDAFSTLGAIIGVVNLDKVDEPYGLASASEWAANGMFHWCVSKPRVFLEPIPYRGQLGLFDVPDEVVREALERARQGCLNDQLS